MAEPDPSRERAAAANRIYAHLVRWLYAQDDVASFIKFDPDGLTVTLAGHFDLADLSRALSYIVVPAEKPAASVNQPSHGAAKQEVSRPVNTR